MKKTKVYLITIGVSLMSTLHAANFGDIDTFFMFGDESGMPLGITDVTGHATSPDGQSVRLFGNVGPITGVEFRPGFEYDWVSGSFQGPINPGDYFVADLSFDPEMTGGSLSWSFYAFVWSNEGFEAAQISTSETSLSDSGPVSGIHLVSSSFTQHGDTGSFEGYLRFEWSGYGPEDTFSLTIPQNSIDITYVSVPEPSTAMLVALGSTLGLLIYARGRKVMGLQPNKIAAGNRRYAFSFGRRGRFAAPRLRRGVTVRACA